MSKRQIPVYQFMTLKEILNVVNFDKANRTSFIDEKENKANGYNTRDYVLLKNRVKKYTNRIFKQNDYEWNLCCPLIIHCVKEAGKKYVSDGQGRLRSMEEAVRKGIISENKEIPVLMVECNTLAEMREDMKIMNTNNCNWNASDMIHSNAVALQGDSLKIERIIKEYQDILEINSMIVPILLVLGEGHRKKDMIPTSIKDINPYRDKFLECFKAIYDYFNSREHTSSRLKVRVKSSSVGIALYSLFTNLMKECNSEYKLFDEKKDKILKKMFSSFNQESDDYIMRIFSSDKKDCKNNIANFLNKNFPKDKTIRATADDMMFGKTIIKIAA